MVDPLDMPHGSSARTLSADITADAVVIVPGIMGSELRDLVTGQTIWGLRTGWYARVWSPFGRGLEPLAVTEDELAGRSGRVAATGLLRWSAFAPILAGLEPYTRLINAVKRVVRHPSAIREFAYDWRLSVEHNVGLLAVAVHDHLEGWRLRSDRPDAQAVLVAHSMGGLLCRALTRISGALDGVRTVITLGTPFDGAAKAAVILGSGAGSPLPAGRLRSVAITMPGVHELLPSYRCVDEGDSVRRLTGQDVAMLGGNGLWARQIFEQRALMSEARMPGHRALVGVAQPTMCTLTLSDGQISGHNYTFRLSGGDLLRHTTGEPIRLPGLGDGTVPRNSALPQTVHAMPLAQQHATLASSDDACQFVCDILQYGQADEGERLGTDDVGPGLIVPDVVAPERRWMAVLTGIEPHAANCVVRDADTGRLVDRPRPYRADGQTEVTITLPVPGIYEVAVHGGSTPIRQLVMAEYPPRTDG